MREIGVSTGLGFTSGVGSGAAVGIGSGLAGGVSVAGVWGSMTGGRVVLVPMVGSSAGAAAGVAEASGGCRVIIAYSRLQTMTAVKNPAIDIALRNAELSLEFLVNILEAMRQMRNKAEIYQLRLRNLGIRSSKGNRPAALEYQKI